MSPLAKAKASHSEDDNMPHQSVKAAEKAAIEGEVADWDTQQCEALREELLPSSPIRASPKVASASTWVAIPPSPLRLKVEPPEPEIESEDELETTAYVNLDLPVKEDGNGSPDKLPKPANIAIELNAQPTITANPTIYIRRDHHGKLRPFRATGEVLQPAEFNKKDQKMTQVLSNMDDLTQRSSMSATQENPPHLYERFNQFDIQTEIRNDFPPTATPADGDSEDPRTILPDPRHASASTGYTYQENDTGHIHLGFESEPVEEDEFMEESQDASYAMPAVQNLASFEPKTPAPPINPFQQRGSVMKGFELFGATQPSSIGRHMASPTSSRPSPDVYNDFSSPPKRRAPVLSSPLGGPTPELEFDGTDATPLQSSVRNILARSQSGNSRNAQSFDTGSKFAWTNPEPRPYVSMRDSQEKRRQTKEPLPDPNSSGDDSDNEAIPRNRRLERELEIQREIAAVGLRKRASTNPRSSAPPSSTAAIDIEVPSTGRRRSFQEEYIAQCIGYDARDTQQDDVIVDSQSGALDNEKSSDGADSSRLPADEETEISRTKAGEDEEVDKDIDADATQQTNSSDTEQIMEQEPSLPLQEVSSNRSNMHTPSSKPQSDTPTDTVPETSPPENRLRPMGEIASLSFGGASEVLPENFPGFTQDLDFDSLMQIRSSPRPPTRIRSSGRGPKSSSMASSGLRTPVIRTEMSSVTSSALSSPPNSAVLQEVEADVVGQAVKEASPIEESEGFEAVKEAGDLREPKSTESDKPLNTPVVAVQAQPQAEMPPSSTIAIIIEPKVDVRENEVEEPNVEAQNIEVVKDITPSLAKKKPMEKSMEKPPPKRPIRTYSKLKGPAARGRSVNTPAVATPRQSTRVAGMTPASKSTETPTSTPRSTPIISTVEKAFISEQQTPQSELAMDLPSASAIEKKRTSKRKSGVTIVHDDALPTRTSKRKSTAKDTSPDPLALSSPAAGRSPKVATGLFKDMTFAVSFVNHEREKDGVTKAIFDHGGRILPDGFDSLFDSAKGFEEMSLSSSAKSVGFVALIADEHSRKAKYMQALALGVPCISGHWITACVAKDSVVDWSPYLLCAGQSSILGNAHKSRVLQPYPAAGARFEDTFANRGKLLEGKSILLITGKGKSQDKRKAYTFLAQALGPSRISQVADYQDARKKLSEQEGQEWDLLYVDAHEKAAEEAVFGTLTQITSSAASRKRKRGPTAAVVDDSPAPKKIRIISDETMIQSLILGQLLDD
ncbi:uncharacterized protein RSE6_11334 [Rhynchosporium secalis]|uniref:BRCT domain-containing protein n=1 Tax=Rhynchosporium secalis TaxID=38038 RepID=A0A1E1MMP8_RHYSE|nr:uncharacterized protein RSE6_11334 [Rhynchosporium secalis]